MSKPDGGEEIRRTPSRENLTKKLARHALRGEFDWGTVKRGLAEIYDLTVLRDEPQRRLSRVTQRENYLGINDLDFVEYKFLVPNTLAGFFGESMVKALVFGLPVDSQVKILLTGLSTLRDSTEKLHPHAVAAFSGPTTSGYAKLPNNGFYSRFHGGENVKFEDTKPSGLRRGAFGITESGELKLLTDAEKWIAVRAGFPGWQYLIGTPYYLDANSDMSTEVPSEGKSHLSYLMQYQMADGGLKTVYAVINRMVSRLVMEEVLMGFCQRMNGTFYRAVELEYSGSHFTVYPPSGRIVNRGGGGFQDSRRDHYFVVPKR
ncbi:hypothetical protein HYS91_01905 [Candidatus Daviesbacteria bacterium]|nr:hypothetical protein [Candidatus Daviesbacteria bacterium]